MHVDAAMRALLVLCLTAATARADDGFDWDAPRPARWEITASTIIQGQPKKNAPSAGLVLAIEHRLEGRLWAGFALGVMGGRQRDDNMEPLPLQTTTFVAATTRLVLGRWFDALDDEEVTEVGIRGELGNAVVTYDGARSTPIITGGGLYGRIGKERTSFMLSFGYGFAIAGRREWLNIAGLDIRMALVRNW